VVKKPSDRPQTTLWPQSAARMKEMFLHGLAIAEADKVGAQIKASRETPHLQKPGQASPAPLYPTGKSRENQEAAPEVPEGFELPPELPPGDELVSFEAPKQPQAPAEPSKPYRGDGNDDSFLEGAIKMLQERQAKRKAGLLAPNAIQSIKATTGFKLPPGASVGVFDGDPTVEVRSEVWICKSGTWVRDSTGEAFHDGIVLSLAKWVPRFAASLPPLPSNAFQSEQAAMGFNLPSGASVGVFDGDPTVGVRSEVWICKSGTWVPDLTDEAFHDGIVLSLAKWVPRFAASLPPLPSKAFQSIGKIPKDAD